MIFNNATNMMLGSAEVDKVMCGSTKVWERSTPVEKYIDDGGTFEYGMFYNASYPDPTKRGQPVPSDEQQAPHTYIRDLTYYEIPVGTTTLYAYVKRPLVVSGEGDLTLVYVYQYDENKSFLAQSWSGKDSGQSIWDYLYNHPGLPISIDPATKYIRISYGQTSARDGGILPDIPDPSAFDGEFIVSNVEVRL